jgi:hypothetical protein
MWGEGVTVHQRHARLYAEACESTPFFERLWHPRLGFEQDVDGRVKPGHDDREITLPNDPKTCETARN